jgi:hypothetical protein
MSTSRPGPALFGRRVEREALDRLVEGVRAGRSSVLVLRGESGCGKTALLEYVLERGSGCRVVRAGGVESEMELAFAGLHQLCASMLDRMERLPGPQRVVFHGPEEGLLNAQPRGRSGFKRPPRAVTSSIDPPHDARPRAAATAHAIPA